MSVLPAPLEEIIDPAIVRNALSQLIAEEERGGVPFVIEHIQQPVGRGHHFQIVPRKEGRRKGQKLGSGQYILDIYDQARLKGRIEEFEQEAERILTEEWRRVSSEEGIEARLAESRPCPLQGEHEGGKYCDESPLSRGRCSYNTGTPLLVPHKKDTGRIDPTRFQTAFAKEFAKRLNAPDEQNVCSYIPQEREEE